MHEKSIIFKIFLIFYRRVLLKFNFSSKDFKKNTKLTHFLDDVSYFSHIFCNFNKLFVNNFKVIKNAPHQYINILKGILHNQYTFSHIIIY